MNSVRLRYLAEVNPPTPEFDEVPLDADIPFLPLEAVWPGDRLDVSRRRPRAEVSNGYTRFREGDVLVPKITPTFEADRTVLAVGLEGGVAAGTTELHIVRPRSGAEPRFIRYLMSSRPFLLGGEATMIGVAGQKRVPEDWLKDFPVLITELPVQRAIADYLDAETARIDALIARKRRMIGLLEEREQAAVLELAGDHRSTPTVTLRQLGTSVLTGPFGTQLAATEYVDGGVPVINPTHILRGRIVPDESVSVSDETAARLSRHKLAEGDIVLGRKGDVGRSAVVGVQNSGWICGSDSIAVRTDPRRLSPAFLALVLHVDLYRQQLAAFSTGAMVTGINEGILLGMQVPCLSLDEQARVTQAARATVEWNERFTSTLGCQIELLTEHRQALITAAVTGALVVPGVSA